MLTRVALVISALFLAVFVHSSLGGVLIQRRDEFEDEHKPQIWSGRTPCYDKDGNVKVLKDPPWYTDDWCHMSICLGLFIPTKSLCFTKGQSCSEGEYLVVVPEPSSPTSCCECKPYEPLK